MLSTFADETNVSSIYLSHFNTEKLFIYFIVLLLL